jgi:chromosome segregation ATPase
MLSLQDLAEESMDSLRAEVVGYQLNHEAVDTAALSHTRTFGSSAVNRSSGYKKAPVVEVESQFTKQYQHNVNKMWMLQQEIELLLNEKQEQEKKYADLEQQMKNITSQMESIVRTYKLPEALATAMGKASGSTSTPSVAHVLAYFNTEVNRLTKALNESTKLASNLTEKCHNYEIKYNKLMEQLNNKTDELSIAGHSELLMRMAGLRKEIQHFRADILDNNMGNLSTAEKPNSDAVEADEKAVLLAYILEDKKRNGSSIEAIKSLRRDLALAEKQNEVHATDLRHCEEKLVKEQEINSELRQQIRRLEAAAQSYDDAVIANKNLEIDIASLMQQLTASMQENKKLKEVLHDRDLQLQQGDRVVQVASSNEYELQKVRNEQVELRQERIQLLAELGQLRSADATATQFSQYISEVLAKSALLAGVDMAWIEAEPIKQFNSNLYAVLASIAKYIRALHEHIERMNSEKQSLSVDFNLKDEELFNLTNEYYHLQQINATLRHKVERDISRQSDAANTILTSIKASLASVNKYSDIERVIEEINNVCGIHHEASSSQESKQNSPVNYNSMKLDKVMKLSPRKKVASTPFNGAAKEIYFANMEGAVQLVEQQNDFALSVNDRLSQALQELTIKHAECNTYQERERVFQSTLVAAMKESYQKGLIADNLLPSDYAELDANALVQCIIEYVLLRRTRSTKNNKMLTPSKYTRASTEQLSPISTNSTTFHRSMLDSYVDDNHDTSIASRLGMLQAAKQKISSFRE